MKPMSLTSPESIASEYGGNKKAIANAARMGLIDPTAALMAGMFIDRMRNAAAEEQKANTTVAQDVFNAPMQQGAPQAPMQVQQPAPTPAPQPQPQGLPAAQMAAAQPQMAPGVEGLPTGEVGEYAGGGIVAFADEGLVQGDPLDAYLGYSPVVEDTPEARIDRERATRELLNQYGVTGPVPFYLTDEDKRKNAKLLNEGEQFKRAAEQREIGRRGAEAAGKEFGLSGIMRGANLNTPFSRLPRAGETTPDMARLMETRRAVQDTVGLPSIMKGRTDLTTPFNRISPEAATNVSPTTTLPKIGSGTTTAPKVDAYGLPVPDPAANLELAKQQAKSLITVPKEESQAEAIAATKNLYKEMGVDSDLYKRQIAKLETEREGLKADKEEAKWTRLIEAGLGVMAGKSQYAAVNIGEGASPALKGFAQDIKDVKKADRELTRAQMALETSENQFKVDQSKSVQNRMEKNQERVDKAQQTVATTTATLGNSLNALSGTRYEAQLRDLSTRFNAEKQFEGTKYHADKSYAAALEHAGATRYAADKDDRAIRQIMKDKNVDYYTAYSLMYDARQRDFDRYNSLRVSVDRADKDFEATPFAMQKSNELSKLDPKKESDKAKIAKIQQELIDAKTKLRLSRGITQASIDYLASEDARLRGQYSGGNATPPPVMGPPPAAIADLKANPTPQAKAQFDQIFGAGAADKALGQ